MIKSKPLRNYAGLYGLKKQPLRVFVFLRNTNRCQCVCPYASNNTIRAERIFTKFDNEVAYHKRPVISVL